MRILDLLDYVPPSSMDVPNKADPPKVHITRADRTKSEILFISIVFEAISQAKNIRFSDIRAL